MFLSPHPSKMKTEAIVDDENLLFFDDFSILKKSYMYSGIHQFVSNRRLFVLYKDIKCVCARTQIF